MEAFKKSFPLRSGIFAFIGSVLAFHTFATELGVPYVQAWEIVLLVIWFTAIMCGYLSHLLRFPSLRGEMFRVVLSKGKHNDIKSAKESILVTHFSPGTPTPEYIDILKMRMDKGVKLTRILPHGIDIAASNCTWLEQFKDKKYGVRYTELHARTSGLPFDITIIDQHCVKIALPKSATSDTYDQGIIIRQREVAELFNRALENIREGRHV